MDINTTLHSSVHRVIKATLFIMCHTGYVINPHKRYLLCSTYTLQNNHFYNNHLSTPINSTTATYHRQILLSQTDKTNCRNWRPNSQNPRSSAPSSTARNAAPQLASTRKKKNKKYRSSTISAAIPEQVRLGSTREYCTWSHYRLFTRLIPSNHEQTDTHDTLRGIVTGLSDASTSSNKQS